MRASWLEREKNTAAIRFVIRQEEDGTKSWTKTTLILLWFFQRKTLQKTYQVRTCFQKLIAYFRKLTVVLIVYFRITAPLGLNACFETMVLIFVFLDFWRVNSLREIRSWHASLATATFERWSSTCHWFPQLQDHNLLRHSILPLLLHLIVVVR